MTIHNDLTNTKENKEYRSKRSSNKLGRQKVDKGEEEWHELKRKSLKDWVQIIS